MSPSEVLGEIAKLMMIDKTHKFMHLADLEWLVIPPVMLRQCRLFRAKDPKSGKTRIVGAVFWAFVTPDISQRFETGFSRLSPNEWRAVDPTDPNALIWIVDVLAPYGNVDLFLKELENTVFNGREFRVRVTMSDGTKMIQTKGENAPV